MKFNKLVHPEIIQNLRGDHGLRRWYQNIMGAISERDGITKISSKYANALALDHCAMTHFTLCKMYVEMRGQCFYIPKDFLLVLSQMDKELPVEYLPNNKVFYFQFAENTLSDHEGPIEGAYIYSGIAHAEKGAEMYGKKCLMMSYINTIKKGEGPTLGYLYIPSEKLKVSDLINSVTVSDSASTRIHSIGSESAHSPERMAIYRAIINAVLYVGSVDSELMRLKPIHNMTRAQKEAYRREFPVENQCSVPITLLNWDYHTGRTYNVDEAFVNTHPRWQRCGPELSQVKLVWVREHTRHFKKGVESAQEEINCPKDHRLQEEAPRQDG